MLKWIGFFLSYFVGRLLHPADAVQNFGHGFGKEAVDLVFDRTRVLLRVIAVGWISSLVFAISLVVGLIEMSRVDDVSPIYLSPTFGASVILLLLSLVGFAYAGSARIWKDSQAAHEAVTRQEEPQPVAAAAPIVDAVVQLIHHYIETHPGDRTNERSRPRDTDRDQRHFDA